jgi:hypothetical protein
MKKIRVSEREKDLLAAAAQSGRHAYANRALGIALAEGGWTVTQIAAATGQRASVVQHILELWPTEKLAALGG